MKIIVLSLILIGLTVPSQGQEIKCYCFEKDAPVMISLQTEAKKIAEWILIKGESAAVVSFMDKSCEQPWTFFEEKFEEHKDKNRVYQIKEVGDSIVFTKILRFDVQDQSVSQEYVYKAKIYSDSLLVHIDYPASDNSANTFTDMTGSPDRKYIAIFKK